MVQQMHDSGDSPEESRQSRKRSALRFPAYDLADSVLVAERIHVDGGGTVSDDALAAYLDYKSTNNGAYLARVAAAKLFGLIEGDRGVNYRLTPRARDIIMPVYDEQRRKALVDAFLDIPLFKAVYDEMRGRDLPPDFGMKNMLRNQMGVTPTRVDVALRTLMNSAETAGFFATRGSRTHLIMPVVQREAPHHDEEQEEEQPDEHVHHGGGGGNGHSGDEPPKPPASASLDQLRADYVGTLITLLREQAKDGVPDAALMARIEALLGIKEPTSV